MLKVKVTSRGGIEYGENFLQVKCLKKYTYFWGVYIMSSPGREERKNWIYFFNVQHEASFSSSISGKISKGEVPHKKRSAKWKIWKLSFQGYATIPTFYDWSGLVTLLCKSQVHFWHSGLPFSPARAHQFTEPSFCSHFSKYCRLENNQWR